MVHTSSTQNRHIPVMLMESLENLKIKKNGIYVDGTLGLGGHSEIILQHIDSGLLIGIDRDEDSISLSKKRLSSNNNFKLFNDSYQNLNIILKELNIQAVDGILLDLGLSSYQLEDNMRGFSHKYESSLDMRFDKNSNDLSHTRDKIISLLSKHIENIEDLCETKFLTPKDLNEQFYFPKGNIDHMTLTNNQNFNKRTFSNNPQENFYQYLHYQDLYYCGAGSFPCGSVAGTPGYICSKQIIKKYA